MGIFERLLPAHRIVRGPLTDDMVDHDRPVDPQRAQRPRGLVDALRTQRSTEHRHKGHAVRNAERSPSGRSDRVAVAFGQCEDLGPNRVPGALRTGQSGPVEGNGGGFGEAAHQSVGGTGAGVRLGEHERHP